MQAQISLLLKYGVVIYKTCMSEGMTTGRDGAAMPHVTRE